MKNHRHTWSGPGGWSCPCCNCWAGPSHKAKKLSHRWLRRGNKRALKNEE